MSTKRREYEYGRLVSVDLVTLGGSLAADASSGASSITVEDASDFDEDGGQLLLNGTVYTYSTWTEDEATGICTITLTGTTLAANATEGTTVAVYDPLYATAATEKACQFEVVGDDGNVDTYEATLALHLVDKVDEGVRGLNAEQVKVELEGDEYVIVDILGLGDPNASGTLAMQDLLTVAATGAQTLPLTFEPIPNSEHLYWNGLYQPGSHWSRSGQTVSIPDSPSGSIAVGDELVMEYLYRKGVVSPPASANFSIYIVQSQIGLAVEVDLSLPGGQSEAMTNILTSDTGREQTFAASSTIDPAAITVTVKNPTTPHTYPDATWFTTRTAVSGTGWSGWQYGFEHDQSFIDYDDLIFQVRKYN